MRPPVAARPAASPHAAPAAPEGCAPLLAVKRCVCVYGMYYAHPTVFASMHKCIFFFNEMCMVFLYLCMYIQEIYTCIHHAVFVKVHKYIYSYIHIQRDVYGTYAYICVDEHILYKYNFVRLMDDISLFVLWSLKCCSWQPQVESAHI